MEDIHIASIPPDACLFPLGKARLRVRQPPGRQSSSCDVSKIRLQRISSICAILLHVGRYLHPLCGSELEDAIGRTAQTILSMPRRRHCRRTRGVTEIEPLWDFDSLPF